MLPGIYSATKSYILTLSQALQAEFGARGLYVQAVHPAAMCTEIGERSGYSPDSIPGMMPVGDLVDAALVGFDRREPVTIPPLPEESDWTSLDATHLALQPKFRRERPAACYLA
ncbi:SDR family oxidoreductase [Roseomonas harenae]|uniref:hypothetical protein n=1 Tax=Muricoccus harenae TaxID=2692566 RepID=UPI001331AA8B|nr:hypothetical protein [Roseomonas harenae]